MKDQREVRMKHIDEYLDWNYQQEHQEEQERRQKKYNTTSTVIKNILTKVSPTSDMPCTNTKMVENLENMTDLLPRGKTKKMGDTGKDKVINREDLRMTNIDTLIQFSGNVRKEAFKTQLGVQRTSPKHFFSQSTNACDTVDGNTLVAQILEYKRFFTKYKTKKKKRDFTRSVRNFNKTPKTITSTTESPYYSYEDYNISTTVDILQSAQHHEDNFKYMTNIPLNVYKKMKQNEADIYQRYHKGEISFNQFQEMRDALISKCLAYTKSTPQYTHPTFNITVSKYPDLGQIDSHGDLIRAWKKVEAFEREMVTSNNTLYKDEFSLAFTQYPPTLPPRSRITRYKKQARDLQISSHPLKRIRKSILEFNNPSLFLNEIDINNEKISPNRYTSTIKNVPRNNSIKKLRTKVQRNLNSSLSGRIRSSKSNQSKDKGNIDEKSNTAKSSNRKNLTNPLYRKSEIKVIQRQISNLKKELDIIKKSLRGVTLRRCKQENGDKDILEKLTNTVEAFQNNTKFHTRPFLYARSGKNGE